jgi:hypothetical protein
MNFSASCTHDLPSTRTTAVAVLLFKMLLRMLANPTPSEMRMTAPEGLTLLLTLHLQAAAAVAAAAAGARIDFNYRGKRTVGSYVLPNSTFAVNIAEGVAGLSAKVPSPAVTHA